MPELWTLGHSRTHYEKTIAVPIIVSTLLLTGCASTPSRETGRYQVSAWAIGTESQRQSGCFVIDTWTGEVWTQDGAKLEKLSDAVRAARTSK